MKSAAHKFLKSKLNEFELLDYDLYEIINTYLELLLDNISASDKEKVDERFIEFYEENYQEDEEESEDDDYDYDD